MKVVVVNSSPQVYNLGADKILYYHRQRGDHATLINGYGFLLPDAWEADKYYFSCIFTYDLPDMVRAVNLIKQHSSSIEIGGPAATAMPQYIVKETGITPHIGLDDRFEHVNGRYEAVFTSRGCPRSCDFCLVPILEGRHMVEYSEFPIPVGRNPYVCDNNILATSWEHQKLVVKKLKGVRNLDLNSGFDDRIFIRDPEKYWRLYNELNIEAWRFAYDIPEQKEPIKKCVEFLHGKGIDYRRIIVFCLVGYPGTTFEECRDKLQYLIDIGCSPYPQRYRPLDSLTRHYTPPGWQNGSLELLFAYYGVPFVWRSCKWEDFRR
jgi:hypothetical protein